MATGSCAFLVEGSGIEPVLVTKTLATIEQASSAL
jgi:hypothetical protein